MIVHGIWQWSLINRKMQDELNEREAKFNVTASFGVDEYREGDSVENLLKRADDALYQAKAAGRNYVRVCVAD